MKRYHEVNIKMFLDVGDKNLVQFKQGEGHELVGSSTSTEVDPLLLPIISRPSINLPELPLNAYPPNFDEESSHLFCKEPLVDINIGNNTDVDPLLLPVSIDNRSVRTSSFLPQEETACMYIDLRNYEEVDPLLLPTKSANQIKLKTRIKKETDEDFVVKLEPLSNDDDPVTDNDEAVHDKDRDNVVDNRIRRLSSSSSSSSSISSSSSSYSSSSSSTYKSVSDSDQKLVVKNPSILNSLRSQKVDSGGCVDKLKLEPVVSLQRLEELEVKEMRILRTRADRQRKLGAGRGNVVSRSTVVTKNHLESKFKRSPSGEKPYPCPWDICSWKFRSWSELQRHYVTHTGQKPYKCRQCEISFKRVDLLVRHRENTHWLETVQMSPVSETRTAFKR